MADPDVLVVGAGPTGLALASGLLANGVPVRVVDGASGPATTSRANILYGRGVEILDRLGALGDLPRRSVEPVTLTTYVHGRPAVTMRLADLFDVIDTRHSALYVSQAEIEARLREHLAGLGGTVAWGTRLTGLERDGDGVTAVLDGEPLRVRWLIGCDGAHSTVRKLAGIGFPGVPVIERFLLADVYLDWSRDRTAGGIFLHADGTLMAIPMRSPNDDLWRLMANVPGESSADPDQREIIETFQRLLGQRAMVTDARIRDAAWTSVFRIQRRLADTYRRGRVLLAGDAAHIHSPVGGQGMNTGMGDAENLAWKLALVVNGLANEPLLDTYQAERRPLAAQVLRTTSANTKLLVSEDPVRRFLRDRVLFPIARLPAVQRRNAATASQLRVHHRRGPLGGGSRLGGTPRPGDRIPDLECTRPDGTATRLHAELGGRWALLVPAGAGGPCVAAATDRLGRYVVELTRPVGRDEVWLVRPDGYLAWRGRPDDLVRWLDGALRRGHGRGRGRP